MIEPETYRSICIDNFYLLVHSNIHPDEVRTILCKVHQLPKCNRPFRRRGFVELKINNSISYGYLKYSKIIKFQRRPNHFFRSIRIIKKGKLLNEGISYLKCRQLELPVPILFFYGEKKRKGIRSREIILSATVFGKTIMECYQDTHDESWLFSAMDCLIKFHRAGISRGDCMLHNFINDGKSTMAIDLEACATLTNETQFNDLKDIVLSILLLSNNAKLAMDILWYYEKNSHLEMPVNRKKILNFSDTIYQNKIMANDYVYGQA